MNKDQHSTPSAASLKSRQKEDDGAVDGPRVREYMTMATTIRKSCSYICAAI